MHCFYIQRPVVQIQCKNPMFYAPDLHCVPAGFTKMVFPVNISGIFGIIHVGFTKDALPVNISGI